MRIRKATLKDLEGICEVAQSVKLDYENPQDQGFLVYVLDKEDYTKRINSSDYFYVALSEDKVVGFLMCYDNENLNDLIENRELDHQDMLTKRVSEQQGEYIFGDQIGIITDKALEKVGTSLMEALFDTMKENLIYEMYVGILHEPFINEASKQFCTKLGFSYQETIINSDNHSWGIYKLKLTP